MLGTSAPVALPSAHSVAAAAPGSGVDLAALLGGGQVCHALPLHVAALPYLHPANLQ